MFLLILRWLSQYFNLHFPAVFTYSSTRMLLAALTSLLLTILLGPIAIRKLYAIKMGQSVLLEHCPMLAELHKKKANTPTMGGILILTTMLVSLFLWMDFSSIYTLILLVTTVVLGSIGALDDYLKMKKKNGLPGKLKFGGQLLLSAAIGVYLIWFPSALELNTAFHPPLAKEQVLVVAKEGKAVLTAKSLTNKELMGRYFFPFKKGALFTLKGGGLFLALFMTIFVIAGSSNAVNLTDGLDGLAAGTVIMTAAVFALIAFLSNHLDISRYLNILYIEGCDEIAIFLSAMIGASLGFLWYNGYPAQVFMGDTGSLALGGILGVCAVLLRREFLLALVGGIFVIEALSVILQVASYKLRNKKRIFLCAPLHHHFEYKGWSETKVVLRFWIIALLLGLIGIISFKFQ